MVEHECPRCHRPVVLPLGALCDACRRALDARASRLARRIAGATTVLLALYVWWRMPDAPVPAQRVVALMGIGISYFLTYLVVRRSARELMR